MHKPTPVKGKPAQSTLWQFATSVLFAVLGCLRTSLGYIYSYTRVGGRARSAHLRIAVLAGLVIAVFTIAGISTVTFPAPASATTANTLNFQARLMSASGAIVPDGNYHIEFKLYRSLAAGGSAQGVCVGGVTDDCLWKETRTTGNLVSVANGYLTVNLGSVTALPTNIWNQQLYLSMRIGGSGGSASWDSEMSPRLLLSAVPAAYSLTQYNSANTFSSNLTLQGPTGGDQNFVLQDQTAAGTYNICIQNSTACGFAPSSGGSNYIQNQNASAQSSSNFWISGTGTANLLQAATIDTPSGTTTLAIGTNNATAGINLNQNTTIGAGKSLTVTNGSVFFQKGTDYATTSTGNDINFGAGAVFRLTGTSVLAITGIQGAANGREITIINASTQTATIANNSGSSSAGNRIMTGTGATVNVPADSSVSLVYDSGSSVWRLVGSSGGGAGISWPLTFTGSMQFQPNSVANNVLTLTNNASATSGITITGTTSDPILSTNGATNLSVQPASGIVMINKASTNNELRVYENSATPTNYASVKYTGGAAVFTASGTNTTQVGSGTGNVTSTLTGQNDTFQFGKTYSPGASNYTLQDFQLTRTLTSTTGSQGGAVFRIQDSSTANAGTAINPTLLLINQASTVGTISGNLIDAQLAGTSKFSVTTTGSVNAATNYQLGGVTALETGSNFLRINQSGQFSAGVWFGSSGLLGSSGGIWLGSAGSTAASQIAIVSSAADTTRRISIDGTNGNVTATGQLSINSGTNIPVADQVAITNTGSTGVTGSGVNGLSVAYKGGAAAVEAGAQRIDLQPGTTTGGTWNGLRIVQNATGPATGVTSTGAKFEGPTTGGAGTYNAINIANIGAVASGGIVRGINITGTNSNAAGTVRGIQLNNLTAGAASEIGIDLGTGWDNLLTYNNGATVIVNGTGQLNGAQLQSASVANASLANSSITVSNGTNITGGAAVSLGGSVTIGVVSAPSFSGQITSTVSTGTAPFVVASTTKVTNLNADLLDGLDSTAFGDATAANQTTILTRIGTNTDAAGTTTLFARLARIDDTDLGATADAASSSGSIFARLTDLYNRIVTLNSSVGATTDAASSTGSVNAKLAYIIANPASGKQQYQQVFTSSGTWTQPSGVTQVEVLAVGGGGGGGGGYYGTVCCTTTNYWGGGGGGGGAVVKQVVSVSGNVSVTIGAGGTGGTANSSTGTGGSGGNTTFGALVTAGGGGGGGNGNVIGGSGSSGGSGGGNYGVGSGGGSDGGSVTYSGSGSNIYLCGGGGGGAGGTATVSGGYINTTSCFYSNGGMGIYGYGGGGGGGASLGFGTTNAMGGSGSSGGGSGGGYAASASAPGNSGRANTGGGGGGGGVYGSVTSGAGGAGGSGIVIVTWWQ